MWCVLTWINHLQFVLHNVLCVTVSTSITCSWDVLDADVACRMLGHRSAQSAPRHGYFGGGLGVIWFDDMICRGDEDSLLDCSHAGVKVHNCNHGDDAGAVCSSRS